MSDKPPYPDMAEVIRRRDFHGIAWVPTTVLRYVMRQDAPDEHPYRQLQQYWETHVINNAGTMVNVHNPSYNQWRDVPLMEDENDLLLGEIDEEQIRPG